ncbi:MAG: prolipoprotein diacylglyceryl transferase [Holosporales bacterium]|jgi:phosphatidylglycerol:prolipoprotein diacylglycerol transferase|nr:prolipoprotein diacylglyceryl transferase [Holosporales bacterium]
MFILSMSPVAFRLFGFPIFWYGILYALAILCSWAIASWTLRKLKINSIPIPSKEEFDKFMINAVLAMLIGARFGHVLFFDFEYYIKNPIEIIMVRNGGLSFHGAFLGLGILLYWYHKNTAFSFKMMTDILCLAGSFGLGIGRIANFINQELYGKVSASDYSVIFTLVDFLPRYPTQLFESFFEGFFNFWILFIIFRIKGIAIIGTGKLSAIFCIIYSSTRFIIEFYKEVESYTYFNFITLTVGQILCIVLLICGIFVLYFNDKGYRNQNSEKTND